MWGERRLEWLLFFFRLFGFLFLIEVAIRIVWYLYKEIFRVG